MWVPSSAPKPFRMREANFGLVYASSSRIMVVGVGERASSFSQGKGISNSMMVGGAADGRHKGRRGFASPASVSSGHLVIRYPKAETHSALKIMAPVNTTESTRDRAETAIVDVIKVSDRAKSRARRISAIRCG